MTNRMQLGLTSEVDAFRFWSCVAPRDNGCWEWLGRSTRDGYGVITLSRRNARAHRVSFYNTLGDIGDGLFVCHSCDNPSCVNPSHLWLGTTDDNMRDLREKGYKKREACMRGHPLSGDNLLLVTDSRRGYPHRKCRTCEKERNKMACRRYRARRSTSKTEAVR